MHEFFFIVEFKFTKIVQFTIGSTVIKDKILACIHITVIHFYGIHIPYTGTIFIFFTVCE